MKHTLLIKKIKDLTEKDIYERKQLWEEEKGNLFNSYHWISSCIDTLENGKDLSIILGKKEGNLVFVMPLIIKVYRLFTFAYSPGKRFLDQACILCSRRISIKPFLLEACIYFWNLVLYEVPCNILKDISSLTKSGAFLRKYSSTTYSLDFSKQKEYYNFSKKKFKELMRLYKKWNFTFEVLTANEIGIDDICRFEKNSSKYFNGRRIFNNKIHQLFFSKLITSPDIKIFLLKQWKNIVSLDLWGCYHDEGFSLYRAYNKLYAKYSPGNVLQYLQLQYMKENNMRIYHMYRGYTYQKKCFSNLSDKQYHLFFFNNIFLQKIFIMYTILNNRLEILKRHTKLLLKKLNII